MELRVLGPLELFADGRTVPVAAAKQRGVLALLVLERGRLVSSDWLIDQLWEGAPPRSARVTLQSCVYRLRKSFESLGAPVGLLTRSNGYVLELPPGTLDLDRFELATAEGQRELEAGNASRAVVAFRSGLGLWRGEAFDGIDLPAVREFADRLRERRLDVTEQCLTAELAYGRHAEVAGELEELTGRYPLRESLWRLRMLALARAGRKADALETYRRLYRLLDEELGVEPSTPVRQLHQQILAGDLALPRTPAAAVAPPADAVVPRMLPAAVGDFTGRKAHLAWLDDLLPPEPALGAPDRREAVVISTISGTAGIGKTMLAVHWAHRVAGRFPDGQLYVNLRGFHPSGQPMRPAEAVRGFLDALGIPADRIPTELDAQVGLYRSLLANRRMLILLDNAHDSQQVRSLLPGAPGCLVLITSRNQLSGLVSVEAARPLQLDLLSTDEARELLTRRLGADRVDAEPRAAEAIIAACAQLPLALAIVAARAATHPGFPLQALADELTNSTDTSSRLDALTDADRTADVRAVFSWSYEQLSPHAARLFRLLGLHPGPDVTMPAATSLAGLPPAKARTGLTELTRAHLLTQHLPGRYTTHDLLRAYAGELARTEAEAERHAAMHRMLDHYLHTAHAADRVLNPSRDPIDLRPPAPDTVPETFADAGQSVGWLGTEHPVLVALIDLAANSGFETHAWQLAWTMVDYLDRYGHWKDWVATQTVALAAAERAHDRAAQARAHDSLIRPYIRLRRVDDAREHAQRALLAYTDLGDPAGEARAHHKVGWVLGTTGRWREALGHMREALSLFRRISHRAGEADAVSGLGWLHTELGNYQLAVAYCRQAIELCELAGYLYGWATSWDLLGRVLHLTGDYAEASDCFRRALERYEDLGDRHNQAHMLDRLGETERAAGDVEAAEEHAQRARDIRDDLGPAAKP